ncbi:MAG: FtsW/RodA/SpoVE family cell cycle protein, partial [Verrucomicrobia bacterium]|nr:FtsW/RodA/SpoVE family cell cycle protein [Verrucomicrobiota bacterium]
MKWFIGCIGVCVAMLITFGLLALYSATYSKLEPRMSSQQTMTSQQQVDGLNALADTTEASWKVAPRNIQGMESLKKQAFFALLGVVLCILIATFFDYHFLNRPEVPIILLVLSAILLTAVFFPAVGGLRVKGASRWIQFGISFQPSELAKLSIIIFLSWYGSRYFSYITHFWRGLIVPMVIIMPLVLLIFKEPDAGSTMFLLAIASCMLLIMGARWFYLAVPAG